MKNYTRAAWPPAAALRGRALAAAGLLLVGATSCTGAAGGAAPSPSPSASAATVVLPDFNSRLGSNRLASEAAAALGRLLYGQGQYWEVYVRTSPPTVPGKYDPSNPAASAPAAATVTQTDVILATETGNTIKSFGAGGEDHERAVLAQLDGALHQAFPRMTIDTIKVFYGESFQHGAAVFNGGKLTQYTVRKLG